MDVGTDRMLTTHTGSLPRTPTLEDLLVRQELGEEVPVAALEYEIRSGVQRVVDKQVDTGIDIINDGEQPRVAFQTYVGLRMKGFGGESSRRPAVDWINYPDYAELAQQRDQTKGKMLNSPQAVAEVEYLNLDEAKRECDVFDSVSASREGQYRDRFMTAASPGIITTSMLDAYYGSRESYLTAVAREMRKEYELIHARGLVLQLDCPDLAMERVRLFQDAPLSQFLAAMESNIEAVNQAVASIPAEQIRLHVCWGNWEGPHDSDVPLKEILPLIYQAQVGAISLELANPRHYHEYKVLKEHPLPDSMVLIAGVIDVKTNFVEHPELVAERILRAVDVVGDRSRVIAGTDCGFGTVAGRRLVAPSVAWAKLRSLREGADLASRELWGSSNE